jgi:hypothetical protein
VNDATPLQLSISYSEERAVSWVACDVVKTNGTACDRR